MKQMYVVLLSLLFAYCSILAQESTVKFDRDAYSSMLSQGTTEINSEVLTVESYPAITGDMLGSHILIANPPPANNGGSTGWGMFFDLIAGPRYVTITGMTTASTGAAGVGFTIEFFTRSGTGLGGQTGPGSSSAGWTSLGTVPVTQGTGGSTGVSELFATPVINLNPGDTVGVAMVFTGVGPRYYGTGTPPLQVFADTNLTLITGESRSTPFTTSGTFFSSRGLVGEIHYDEFIPVEFISFSASVIGDGNAVELNWMTATELNNHGFQIERKTSSTDWENIGFVEGYGTTTEARNYSFVDDNLESDTYSYRLKQIDFNGTFEYYELTETIEIGLIKSYNLSQNYPNPFNPATTISLQVPVSSYIALKVYDALGGEIATLLNEEKPAGSYEVVFNAVDLPSGVYFYRIQAGEFTETKRMILMK